MTIPDSHAACFANHMGLWHIETQWFNRAFSAVKAGILQPEQATDEEQRRARMAGYQILNGGVAFIPVHGHLTKYGDSFGAGSTVQMRRALRLAVRDEAVTSVLLHFDTPGGHVAGTDEFARDIRLANVVKPVYGHIDDLGASAGYYLASQTRRITANAGAEIGSIGTLMVVADYSGMAEMAGITVHVVSTGAYKGAGVPGAEVTEEHLAYFQERVDSLNALFLQAVQQGRGFSDAQVRQVSDGRVFIASRSQELGLIDAVLPFDQSLAEISQAGTRGGIRMSLSEQMDKIFQSLGGKGRVVIEEAPTEEPLSTTDELLAAKEALDAGADPQGDFQQSLAAMLDEAKATGFVAGHEEGVVEGTATGLKGGTMQGRKDAAEIAGLCQVAEVPEMTHKFLAAKEDGSYMSAESIRAAINEARVQEDEKRAIVSQIIPAEKPGQAVQKEAGAPMTYQDVYDRRRDGR